MPESTNTASVQDVEFEAFGVRIGITVDSADVRERILPLLPPGALPCRATPEDQWFGIHTEPSGTYQFTRDGSRVTANADLDLALMLLDNQLRIEVGLKAPERIFVHAGVVAHNGRALVMPGQSFVGKTTLVAALVRAGAIYYSDEFAVLDLQGRVHPYAKALGVRDETQTQIDRDVAVLGGIAGDEPVPVGAVVVTRYEPGRVWEPARITPGRAALALVSNAVAALERSEEVMAAISRAAQAGVLLEGERGEADAMAGELLQLVGSPA